MAGYLGAKLVAVQFDGYTKPQVDDKVLTVDAKVLAVQAELASHVSSVYTKTEIDSLLQGLDPKAAVRVATTQNISLSGLQTIDGVSLLVGDRVLVWKQTAAAQNGIYVVSSGTWLRATDMDVWAEIPGAYVFVHEGTTQADLGYVCTSDAGGTLGSTPITFVEFNGAANIIPGYGLHKDGNTLELAPSGITAGTYQSITVDSYGRATAGAALSSTHVTTALGYTPIAPADTIQVSQQAKTAYYDLIGDYPLLNLYYSTALGRLFLAEDIGGSPIQVDVATQSYTVIGYPNNAAGYGYPTRVAAALGTGQANATGGNGYVEILGGGATSTWTSFLGVGSRRRGGISLQAGTAQADAGNTYVHGSTIEIQGRNGTNNGTAAGVGTSIRIFGGGTTRTDSGTNGAASVLINGASGSAGGSISLNSGSYNVISGISSSGAFISLNSGNSTNGGDLMLAAGSGPTNGKVYISRGGYSYEALDAGNLSSYSPSLTGVGASGTWAISISGSAAQLGGYAASNYLGYNGNSYYQAQASLQFTDPELFLYWDTPAGQRLIRPPQGTFASFTLTGSRNNYAGLNFNSTSNGTMDLLFATAGGESGVYNESFGWQLKWMAGVGYIFKGQYGGGTGAIILDSVNYADYAPTLTGGGASGTWAISISGSAASATALSANAALTTPVITGTREKRVAMTANNIDLATGNYFTKTISVATTLTVSNIPTTGTSASFILDLTNGGAAAITWWSGVKWASGLAPTLTLSGRDVLGFFTHDGGTTWTGLLLGRDVK